LTSKVLFQNNLHVHAEVFHEFTVCPRNGTRFLPISAR
jgi:hypothetical protein